MKNYERFQGDAKFLYHSHDTTWHFAAIGVGKECFEKSKSMGGFRQILNHFTILMILHDICSHWNGLVMLKKIINYGSFPEDPKLLYQIYDITLNFAGIGMD